MARAARRLVPPSALLALLVLAPLLSGCAAPDEPEVVTDHGWQVGDRWVYLRESDGVAGVYVRQVTAIYEQADVPVFELAEGFERHPIQQTTTYTVDRLAYTGSEVRLDGELRTRMRAEAPLPFHYVFPLEPGTRAVHEGTIHQTADGLRQEDPVRVTTHVEAPRSLTLDERVYEVYPYEIRIEYLATPIDESPIIRGHWAPAVGQSVRTTVTEGATERTYTLLSFQRAEPRNGPPAYDLVPGLTSRAVNAGFEVALEGPGYERHLVHVLRPLDVELSFSAPVTLPDRHATRIDLASLRPLGYARAGLASNATDLVEPGTALHLAVARRDAEPLLFHAPHGEALQRIRLEPGQVYELLVASNTGGAQVVVHLGDRRENTAPAETGDVTVLAATQRHVRTELPPGPHDIRDNVQAIVAVPDDARIEGLVYARNLGGADASIGEVGAMRNVGFALDDRTATDAESLYAFFVGHEPSAPFSVQTSFHYRAEMAVRGVIEYELGALLLRLDP